MDRHAAAGRTDQAQTFYRGIRDRFAPGASIWITEMAQTACGGDPWSSTFLDTFRFVDQLGRLARQDVSIVFHNTLAASDYALIDDVTWHPRPNYWAALLWRRVMGGTVLDTGNNAGDLHVYAHCLRGQSGGVGVVAINLNQARSAQFNLPMSAERFTLTGGDPLGNSVRLNGRMLALRSDDTLPRLVPVSQRRGSFALPAASVTFLAVRGAGNPACR